MYLLHVNHDIGIDIIGDINSDTALQTYLANHVQISNNSPDTLSEKSAWLSDVS